MQALPIDEERQPSTALRSPIVLFFALTFALSAGTHAVNSYVTGRLEEITPPGTPIGESPLANWLPFAFYLTNAGPSVAGVSLAFYLYGWTGLRELLRRLSPWFSAKTMRVVWICLLVPMVFQVAVLMAVGSFEDWSLSAYLYGALIGGAFLGAGMCEELGWRGFALPHLQRRYSALTSSMIIGVTWGLWHWPNYLINAHPHPLLGLALCVPAGIVASCLYTWAFNSSEGSLLPVIVLHGTTVTTTAVASIGAVYPLVSAIISTVIAGALVWFFGPETISSEGKAIATLFRLHASKELDTDHVAYHREKRVHGNPDNFN